MGVRCRKANVTAFNARVIGNSPSHTIGECLSERCDFQGTDDDLAVSGTEGQRPDARRLTNPPDASLLSWWAMESSELNAQGRRDVCYTFTGLKNKLLLSPGFSRDSQTPGQHSADLQESASRHATWRIVPHSFVSINEF
jgi:hypothetical protein